MSDIDASLRVPGDVLLKFALYSGIRPTQLHKFFISMQLLNPPGSIGHIPGLQNFKEVAMESFEILWELYWNQPQVLDEMISSLVIPVPKDRQYPQTRSNPAFQEPQIRGVIRLFYPFTPTLADGLAWNISLLRMLERDLPTLPNFNYQDTLVRVEEFIQQCTSGSHIVNELEICQQFSQARFRSPSWLETIQCLRSVFDGAQNDVNNQIVAFLNQQYANSSPPSDALSTSSISSRLQGNPSVNSIVLFAPSGAGKTHEILNHLSQNFGLYFQACSLPLSKESSGIHDPHRRSGSKDTFLLGQLIVAANTYIDRIGESGDVHLSDITEYWFSLLIGCRYFTLTRFFTLCKLSPHWSQIQTRLDGNQVQRLWLVLQTCDTQDLFTPLFQRACMLSLIDKSYVTEKISASRLQQTVSKLEVPHFSGPLCLCLDEAQADLTTSIYSQITGAPRSLLSIWTTTFMEFFLNRNYTSLRTDANRLKTAPYFPQSASYFPGQSDTAVFSGTSLKLKNVISTVKTLYSLSVLVHSFDWNTDEIFHLPQVRTDDDFRYIMGQSELAATLSRHYNNDKADIETEIVSHARSLFGRPRWPVMYLWKLNEAFRSSLVNSWGTTIEQTVKQTCRCIVDDLVSRLNDLKSRECSNPKYYELMENLCHITIYQEMMDSGYFFMDDEEHLLITEGFAYMMPFEGGFQQVISEALAEQAAKEYFLVNNVALVEKQLNRLIESQQNDRSALGKTAEWFLAWNLNRAFRKDQSRVSGSPHIGRSMKILQSLSRATPLNFDIQSTLDLSGYSVIEGSKIGYMYSKDNSSQIHLSTWMNSATTLNPTATFYFPEEQAGPDVVFALRPPEGVAGSIVLVLLQLKITRSFVIDEANETTNLSQAYMDRKAGTVLNGYGDVKSKLNELLNEWSTMDIQQRPRILRVLFTAVTLVGNDKKKPPPGTHCPEYYVRIGQKDTSDYFGQEFDFLLNYWRANGNFQNQRPSLKMIYQKLVELRK